MNHNETETSIALSYTTGSVFTCPHVPELTWDVHDTITPWIFAVVSFTISPTAVLFIIAMITSAFKRTAVGEIVKETTAKIHGVMVSCTSHVNSGTCGQVNTDLVVFDKAMLVSVSL